MGRDKALLELEGRTLLVRATEVLQGLGAPVVLACGAEDRYGETGLERVLDRRAGAGPLAGLEAALARAATESGGDHAYVGVLACDMPRATVDVFDALLARVEDTRADACLFETDQGMQPMLAIYSTACLPAVRAALDAGERRMVAFHEGFGDLEIQTVRRDELEEGAGGDRACNLNTPDEYRAEGGLGQ